MNQVSRPMQIALAAVLVFAVVWFAVLRPTDPAEDVVATPLTPVATTPSANATGSSTESGIVKTIDRAKSGAAAADAAVKDREAQTGEEAPSTPDPSTPDPSTPAAGATTDSGADSGDAAPAADSAAATDKPRVSSSQARADAVIEDITADLAKRRAVVVLVWSSAGKEDRIMQRRVTSQINKRGGRVKVYLVPVGQVARYDGLLSPLSLGQTPSTVVIAPNNQAKVLGGLASTVRIDRLTSSATLMEPVATQ